MRDARSKVPVTVPVVTRTAGRRSCARRRSTRGIMDNDSPTLATSAVDPNFIEDGGAVGLFSSTTIDTIEPDEQIRTLQLTVDGLQNGADEFLTIDGESLALADVTEEVNFLRVGQLNRGIQEYVPVILVFRRAPDLRIRRADGAGLVRCALSDQGICIGTLRRTAGRHAA